MEHSSEVFVGIDVAKALNAIAVAYGEHGGKVRFVGEVDAAEASMRRVVKRIAASCDRAHVAARSAERLIVLARRWRRGLKDVGDQALMRALATAVPSVSPGPSLSYSGRRPGRPQSV